MLFWAGTVVDVEMSRHTSAEGTSRGGTSRTARLDREGDRCACRGCQGVCSSPRPFSCRNKIDGETAAARLCSESTVGSWRCSGRSNSCRGHCMLSVDHSRSGSWQSTEFKLIMRRSEPGPKATKAPSLFGMVHEQRGKIYHIFLRLHHVCPHVLSGQIRCGSIEREVGNNRDAQRPRAEMCRVVAHRPGQSVAQCLG